MANPWQIHVKDTMKKNPGMKLKNVLKLAAKSYKKKGKTVSKKTAKRGKKGSKKTRRKRKGKKK